MDRSENLGVRARHARSDPTLQGFEAAEDGRRLEDGEQETQHFQSCANISIVDLVRLLLRGQHRPHTDDISTPVPSIAETQIKQSFTICY